MTKPPHRPVAKAQSDTPPQNVEPLARGFGDEHGGYIVDAQAEHTVADPGDASPDAKKRFDSGTRPGRGASAAGAKKRD